MPLLLFQFSSSTRSLLSNRSLRCSNPQQQHQPPKPVARSSKSKRSTQPERSTSCRRINEAIKTTVTISPPPTPSVALDHHLKLSSDTIAPTREERKVMRHISALGMEDPTISAQCRVHQGCSNMDNANFLTLSEDASHIPAPPSLQEHPSLLFEDMAWNDLPNDMRSLISVASDRTADSERGIDMELFHSSLGYIMSDVDDFATTTTTTTTNTNTPKLSKDDSNSRNTVIETSNRISGTSSHPTQITETTYSGSDSHVHDGGTSHQVEGSGGAFADTSQLFLRSDLGPTMIACGKNLSPSARQRHEEMDGNSAMHKALNSSMQSFQSLSLEELQNMNQMDNHNNAAFRVYDGGSTRSETSQSRAQTQNHKYIRAPHRLHKSYPDGALMSERHSRVSLRRDSNAAVVPTTTHYFSSSSRKPSDWKAPLYVASCKSMNALPSTQSLSNKSRSNTKVAIPRQRALPSIVVLFPDDGATPTLATTTR